MSDFQKLIADAQGIYTRLAANNSKTWWQENRAVYDENLKPEALRLLDVIQPTLATLSNHDVKGKLFRPHRDVRFSKDKTPYNTHLHMMWAVQTDAPQNPVFFFGIGQDYVTAGAGMMGLDKPVLENWRKFVDLDTARIQSITHDLTAAGYRFREPALKRVPPPFDKDHAAGDLLRMKGVLASRDLGGFGDLEGAISAAFTKLWPLNAFLLQVAEA